VWRCGGGALAALAVSAGGGGPSGALINRGLIEICAEGKLAVSCSLSPVSPSKVSDERRFGNMRGRSQTLNTEDIEAERITPDDPCIGSTMNAQNVLGCPTTSAGQRTRSIRSGVAASADGDSRDRR
jgi:hypothetical protein